jgi:hypothetical protein
MKKILLVGLAVCSATAAHADGSNKTIQAALDGPSVLSGGDANGSGDFSAVINDESNSLCYSLSANNIGAAGVAHIHEGAAGAPGRPVIDLAVTSGSCISVNHGLLEDIKNNPSDYYVDVVHASTDTDAIRGQLVG